MSVSFSQAFSVREARTHSAEQTRSPLGASCRSCFCSPTTPRSRLLCRRPRNAQGRLSLRGLLVHRCPTNSILNSSTTRLLLHLRRVHHKSLASLPRRKTDGAVVIRCQDTELGKARVFKLNATPKDPILVERADGYERQYQFQCPRCTLPVAYQTTPPPAKSGPHLYILKGALSQIQGQVPPDAFADEEPSQA